MRKTIIATLLVSLFSTGCSGLPKSYSTVDPWQASGEMATNFHNTKLNPAGSIKDLPRRAPRGDEQRIVAMADQMFNERPTLSIILVDHGEIIYENYARPSGPDKPNFSWSMSKSLTAYTIGNMMCDGKIKSLDDKANKYTKDLDGTVYGDATIRQLMTMSSGVSTPEHSGNIKPNSTAMDNEWMELRANSTTTKAVLKAYGSRGRDKAGNPIAAGTVFNYNAGDALAAGNIADNQGGMVENFQHYIWNNIGAESPGYWLVDPNGSAMSMAGFSATTRDWARLAMYSMKQMKSGSPCMQSFMKQATTPQIENVSKRVGEQYAGYGFFTWILNKGPRPSYWWAGYGGQRVGVDPVKERIIVVTSSRESYMGTISKVFNAWQEL